MRTCTFLMAPAAAGAAASNIRHSDKRGLAAEVCITYATSVLVPVCTLPPWHDPPPVSSQALPQTRARPVSLARTEDFPPTDASVVLGLALSPALRKIRMAFAKKAAMAAKRPTACPAEPSPALSLAQRTTRALPAKTAPIAPQQPTARPVAPASSLAQQRMTVMHVKTGPTMAKPRTASLVALRARPARPARPCPWPRPAKDSPAPTSSSMTSTTSSTSTMSTSSSTTTTTTSSKPTGNSDKRPTKSFGHCNYLLNQDKLYCVDFTTGETKLVQDNIVPAGTTINALAMEPRSQTMYAVSQKGNEDPRLTFFGQGVIDEDNNLWIMNNDSYAQILEKVGDSQNGVPQSQGSTASWPYYVYDWAFIPDTGGKDFLWAIGTSKSDGPAHLAKFQKTTGQWESLNNLGQVIGSNDFGLAWSNRNALYVQEQDTGIIYKISIPDGTVAKESTGDVLTRAYLSDGTNCWNPTQPLGAQ